MGYYSYIPLEFWGDDDGAPDLFALTGIASGDVPIVVDIPLRLSEVGIISSLGWFPEMRGPGDSIPQGTLLVHLVGRGLKWQLRAVS